MTAMAQLSGNVILIAVSLGAKFRDLAVFFHVAMTASSFMMRPPLYVQKNWPSFKIPEFNLPTTW